MAARELEITERTVSVWGGRLDLTVQVAGQGPPLVYLHSAAGLAWDPFLERLASDYTIYAPQVPGTTPGKPDAIRELDDIWGLVLVYEETIRRLGLDGSVDVGQSFGGSSPASSRRVPALFSRVIVLDPIGLWLDEHPVANWVSASPEEVAAMLSPTRPARWLAGQARRRSRRHDRRDRRAQLGDRLHSENRLPDSGQGPRETAPSDRGPDPRRVGQGRQGSSAYAEEFGRHIVGSRVEVPDECGHIPQLEQPEKTLALVTDSVRGRRPRGQRRECRFHRPGPDGGAWRCGFPVGATISCLQPNAGEDTRAHRSGRGGSSSVAEACAGRDVVITMLADDDHCRGYGRSRRNQRFIATRSDPHGDGYAWRGSDPGARGRPRGSGSDPGRGRRAGPP